MKRDIPAQLADTARTHADLVSVWRVCGEVACLRARRCRGNGLECLARCMPLLPELVHDFLTGLGEAHEAGRTWNQALDDLWEEWLAVGEWNGIVRDSLVKRAKRARPPA